MKSRLLLQRQNTLDNIDFQSSIDFASLSVRCKNSFKIHWAWIISKTAISSRKGYKFAANREIPLFVCDVFQMEHLPEYSLTLGHHHEDFANGY